MILEKEICLIQNETLREKARGHIIHREEMLKIYPSSLGGKYHPPDERGPGGLIKHIKRMVHILHEASPHFGLSEDERDILIYCAVMHDLSNIDISEMVDGEIVRDRKMYGKWHGVYSSHIASDDLRGRISIDTLFTIQGIIRSHTGAWLPNNRQPSSKLEIIFSMADFISTRENVMIEVD